MRSSISIVSVLLVSAMACDPGTSGPSNPGESPGRAALDDDASTPAAAAPVALAADWEEAVDTQVQRLRTDDPARYTLLRDLEPLPTRAGFLRFSTSVIHDPAAAAVFLDRLAHGHASPAVRAALVEALPRTGGDFSAGLLAIVADEDDTSVRRAAMGAFARAEPDAALAGLALGLVDPEPEVRAEAARVAGTRADGVDLTDALVVAAGDADAGVRADAVRALGLLGNGFEAIAGRFADDNAAVRLQAVRAAARIDAEAAKTHADFATLLDDAEPRVRAAASAL